MHMAAILKVENLTKSYGKTTAVDHISFEVNEGEVVGLLGPNGAGKSTTIHMLLSLLEPTGGSIEIFGKNLATHREEILQSMNFATSYSMLPHNLTPLENLKVSALFYGVRNWKEKAGALIEEFNLGSFKNARTGSLSSGEQMRLVLAKAFLNDPKPSMEIFAFFVPFVLLPFSAVYYPVSVLPDFIQQIAFFLPTMHLFEGMRAIFAQEAFPLAHALWATGLNVVYFILGLAFFAWMIRVARKKGLIARLLQD